MKIKAFAKINLTLDITGIRSDGFHTIRSVMVPITLYDELTLEKANEFSFDCNIKELCNDKNLCVRAANMFFEESGIAPTVSLYLQKYIPFPAGLGGGSADAAAVLDALNDFYNKPLSKEKLFELAARLGSDVPFCLLGKAALCEGRGEILTPLNEKINLDIVIAIGKGRLPTPEVYRQYDSMNLEVKNDTDMLLNALNKEFEALIASLGNAFEPVADIMAPETKLLREEMYKLGAVSAHLSGSGPSVYCITENSEKAKEITERLNNMGYFAVACKTV